MGPDGIISTVVGGGNPADGLGDGDRPGCKTATHYPHGVAFDAAGNLFIADSFAHRVPAR